MGQVDLGRGLRVINAEKREKTQKRGVGSIIKGCAGDDGPKEGVSSNIGRQDMGPLCVVETGWLEEGRRRRVRDGTSTRVAIW